MVGVSLTVDKEIRRQVEAILAENGLLKPKTTKEEAKEELLLLIKEAEQDILNGNYKKLG